jgi:hypothetical protein
MKKILFMILLACIPANVWAEDGAAPMKTETAKDDGLFRFPNDENVRVDRKAGIVYLDAELSPSLTGQFAMLEFLLISGQLNSDGSWLYDRAYESLFVTKAQPETVHVALMLAGFKPGQLPQEAPEGFAKENSKYVGDKQREETEAEKLPAQTLDIFVEWEKDGEKQRLRCEKFIYDRNRKVVAADTPWAFTGSYLLSDKQGKKILAANDTRVLFSVFFDESAVINLPFYTTNPYWGEDTGMEVNAASLPEDFRQTKTIVEGVTEREIFVPVQRKVTLILQKSTLPPPEPKTGEAKPAGDKPVAEEPKKEEK